MTAVTSNIVSCPFCGADVIEGSDNCDNCGQSLMGMQLPEWALNITDSHFSTPISAIRLSKPVTVSPRDSLRDAIRVIAAASGGAAVVLDGQRVCGIFTERDVLAKVAAGAGSLDAPVAEYMTPDPVILRDDDTMATALHKMGEGGFRHIPLVRDGELVAMVNARDIATWLLTRYFDE
jgi:CBS domain-containing protein